MSKTTLPSGYVECTCGRATTEAVCRCGRRIRAEAPIRAQEPRTPVALPNRTEQEAIDILPGNYEYEAQTFGICGGATYTPDWVDMARRVAIEVKGEYVHSRDSRLRFDEARTLHPGWTWIWARKRTTGRRGPRWEVEVYCATGRSTLPYDGRSGAGEGKDGGCQP